MEAEAEAIFAEIQRAGGVIRAIEGGYFRRRIADSAFRFQSEVDARRKLIVGVNAFVEPDAVTIPLLAIEQEIERRQKANLAQIKATRNSNDVGEAPGTFAARPGRPKTSCRHFCWQPRGMSRSARS